MRELVRRHELSHYPYKGDALFCKHCGEPSLALFSDAGEEMPCVLREEVELPHTSPKQVVDWMDVLSMLWKIVSNILLGISVIAGMVFGPWLLKILILIALIFAWAWDDRELFHG